MTLNTVGRAFWTRHMKGICWQSCPASAETEGTPPPDKERRPSPSVASRRVLQARTLAPKSPSFSPKVSRSFEHQPPSHMKSRTSAVTSHFYLEKCLWQRCAGSRESGMLFVAVPGSEGVRVWLFSSEILIRGLPSWRADVLRAHNRVRFHKWGFGKKMMVENNKEKLNNLS